ncbi:MAG: hypothetical protein ACQEU4_12565 [Bacillota bacterium]
MAVTMLRNPNIKAKFLSIKIEKFGFLLLKNRARLQYKFPESETPTHQLLSIIPVPNNPPTTHSSAIAPISNKKPLFIFIIPFELFIKKIINKECYDYYHNKKSNNFYQLFIPHPKIRNY